MFKFRESLLGMLGLLQFQAASKNRFRLLELVLGYSAGRGAGNTVRAGDGGRDGRLIGREAAHIQNSAKQAAQKDIGLPPHFQRLYSGMAGQKGFLVWYEYL